MRGAERLESVSRDRMETDVDEPRRLYARHDPFRRNFGRTRKHIANANAPVARTLDDQERWRTRVAVNNLLSGFYGRKCCDGRG